MVPVLSANRSNGERHTDTHEITIDICRAVNRAVIELDALTTSHHRAAPEHDGYLDV